MSRETDIAKAWALREQEQPKPLETPTSAAGAVAAARRALAAARRAPGDNRGAVNTARSAFLAAVARARGPR